MNIDLNKLTRRIVTTVQITALLTMLCGLSSCKKTDQAENSSQEAILEQEGELQIEIPEGEDTYGE